jgi:hypothetical protein
MCVCVCVDKHVCVDCILQSEFACRVFCVLAWLALDGFDARSDDAFNGAFLTSTATLPLVPTVIPPTRPLLVMLLLVVLVLGMLLVG